MAEDVTQREPRPWWIRCWCTLTEDRGGGLKRDWNYPISPGCPVHDPITKDDDRD